MSEGGGTVWNTLKVEQKRKEGETYFKKGGCKLGQGGGALKRGVKPLTNYAAKIGKLLWISNQTRPKISLGVSNLALELRNATVEDIKYCNKIISTVTSDSYKLEYQKLHGNLKLVLYTDASYRNLPNCGTK